ncbi:GNAT family N-acetyltransferase [Streptomyces viridochromogenes]|uniref:Putative Acetyltransferase n=1 Tax=Streptomyces viridochromogenes Tue57 TaxID=1160705 RepID=L8PCF0_STRVR|nr:GNAT family N-acetyltransferase [Streptomyces viridochromogenes]ELS54090.1 putative Acetyltransferase [Streptomyces viridochromogenes Tue57]
MTTAREPHPDHPYPDLHGHGLRLRPWRAESEADVETWFRGRTDSEFRRWDTPLRITTDLDSARESLRDAARNTAEGASASYCVTDAATGTPLGHIGVNLINRVMNSARVGYWALPEARGRRVATHALALVARWALSEPGLGLHRLELDHADGHDSSGHIAERCGFRYEGTLRGAIGEAERHDAYRDMHLHARLATDPDVNL